MISFYETCHPLSGLAKKNRNKVNDRQTSSFKMNIHPLIVYITKLVLLYIRTEEKKSQVCHYWFSISLFSRPKHIESDYHILGIATTEYAKESVHHN